MFIRSHTHPPKKQNKTKTNKKHTKHKTNTRTYGHTNKQIDILGLSSIILKKKNENTEYFFLSA